MRENERLDGAAAAATTGSEQLGLRPEAGLGDPDGGARRQRPRRVWGGGQGARGFQITDTDLTYLRWLTRVRYATAPQLARRFGVSAHTAWWHVRKLCDAELAWHRRLIGHTHGIYLPTGAGCRLIDSPLRPPTFSEGTYWHTLGLTDLTIRFELEGRTVITERELRGMEPDPELGRIPYAIPFQGSALHYPDMVLPRDDGRVVAIELELSRKWASTLKEILLAYARVPLVAQVLYFTPHTGIRNRLATIAERANLEELVFIRPFPTKQEARSDGRH